MPTTPAQLEEFSLGYFLDLVSVTCNLEIDKNFIMLGSLRDFVDATQNVWI
jgi:hypothetical protein